MRRRPKTLYALIAALVLLLTLPGCAHIGSALIEGGSGTEAPGGPAFEEPSPTPEPAEEKPNPVFTLLSDFIVRYRESSDGLMDAVFGSGSPELSVLYTALAGDEAMLSRLYVTVGMLARDEDSRVFTGTFAGAYAGQGTLRLMNSFRYEFESGDELVGTLSGGNSLHCAYTLGSETVIMDIKTTENGYLARVERGGSIGFLETSGSGLRYVRLGADEIPETDGFPEDTGAETLLYSEGKASLSE